MALDPQYAEAYAWLSRTLSWSGSGNGVRILRRWSSALALAQQAVALDDSLPRAYEELAFAYLYKRQHEQAIAVAKRAITLAPNEAEGSGMLGHILNFAGGRRKPLN